MNDAEFEVQKARVERLREKWVKTLGLAFNTYEFIYHRGAFTSKLSSQFEPGTALTTTHWPYMRFEVEWNLAAVADYPDDDLEHIVVHELAHVLIEPMGEEDPNLRELTCEGITKAIRWAVALIPREESANG